MTSTPGPEESDAGLQATEQVYRILAAAAVSLITAGTVVYHTLEDWSWVDSFYFSVIAVTTVGFGDLTPSTDGSKLFTVAYIVTGISIIGTFLDVRLKRHGTRYRSRRR